MKTIFAIADIHFPHHHEPTIKIAKKICKDLQPDHFVYLGDNFDAEGISRFTNKTAERGIEETIKEVQGFKKLHEEFENITPKSKFYWCGGNHDMQRIKDIREKCEDKRWFERLDRIDECLDLEKEFPKINICEYNEFFKIGKLTFTHGEFCGSGHAKKTNLTWGGNKVYGHCHDIQMHTLQQKGDYPRQALSLGCACEDNPNYMKNKSSAWVHAVGVGYLFPDGNYNFYPIQINNRKCIFNGKIYKA